MSGKKIIMLADMESFYASVEVAKNPSLQGKPVVVCGDPQRRHGIVLAATKEAKAWGIKTGMAAWECARLCPHVFFIRPHMKEYLEVSLKITKILQGFTDRVVPYSIDEQFLDMSGCKTLFGPPEEMALRIKEKIWKETKINCRIGIGENPLQAKMACNCFAKKNPEGIFQLTGENYAFYTWPLPVRSLFGVGERMEQNLYNMGVRTIGHLAALRREDLKLRWGVSGEILWLNAHGIDNSTLEEAAERKSVGCSLTLPRDYYDKKELEVVLLELTEETCRRARALGMAGNVVHLYCRGADFDYPSSFSRQHRLPAPTALTMEVYPFALKLFYKHWDRKPVRTLGMALGGLTDYHKRQLSLLDPGEKKIVLSRAMDRIRERFGLTSLFRLSSLKPGGQLFNRATKIGGHEA